MSDSVPDSAARSAVLMFFFSNSFEPSLSGSCLVGAARAFKEARTDANGPHRTSCPARKKTGLLQPSSIRPSTVAQGLQARGTIVFFRQACLKSHLGSRKRKICSQLSPQIL